MQISGLVLDVYDDVSGDVLRGIYASQESIPEHVKVAHALSSEERMRLPDDLFALILTDGEQFLRKFACTDAGNTALSVQYFLKNSHKLPESVQEKVAENLAIACSWYGLEKEAGLLGVAGKGLNTAIRGQQAVGVAKELGARGSALREMGPGVHTPEEVAHAALGKIAEVTGTPDMPVQAPTNRKMEAPKAVIQKTAMTPHVDIRELAFGVERVATQSTICALGDKYPLDSYSQVKQASEYFEEYGRRMSPEDRHEYCRNLVKRADALAIDVSDLVRKYGSEGFAPPEEIKLAFDSRRDLVTNEYLGKVLNALEKQAGQVDPDVFCIALHEFDKEAGLTLGYDTHLMDPFYSTYGFEKKAEFSETIGNDTVTEKDLKCLALKGLYRVKKVFMEEVAEEFLKDPVGIYKSMPVDQKKILMRMAQECRSEHG